MGACASWCGGQQTSSDASNDVPYVVSGDGHATLRPHSGQTSSLLASLRSPFRPAASSDAASRHAMQRPLLADEPLQPAPSQSHLQQPAAYEAAPATSATAASATASAPATAYGTSGAVAGAGSASLRPQLSPRASAGTRGPAFVQPAPLLSHVVLTDADGERLAFGVRRPTEARLSVLSQNSSSLPASSQLPTPPPLHLTGGAHPPQPLLLPLAGSSGSLAPLDRSADSLPLGASAGSVALLLSQPPPPPAPADPATVLPQPQLQALSSSTDSLAGRDDSSSSSSWTGGVSGFAPAPPPAAVAALSASTRQSLNLSSSTSSLPPHQPRVAALAAQHGKLLRQSSGQLARELLSRRGSAAVVVGLAGSAHTPADAARDRSLSNALIRPPVDLTRQLRSSHSKFPKFPAAARATTAGGAARLMQTRPKQAAAAHVHLQAHAGARAKSLSTSSLVASPSLVAPDEEELVRCMGVALWLHLARAFAAPPAQQLLLDVFSDARHAPLGPEAAAAGAADALPELDTVYRFVSTIVHAERLAPECCILALAYIERMIDSARVAFAPSTWRRMTLSALILASKVWEDQAVWNVDFINVFPHALTCAELNQLEKATLGLLQYNASLPASMYARYYFALRDLSDLPDHAYPPPLDPAAAGALEARAASHARRRPFPRSQSADRLTSKPPLLVLS